MTEEMRVLIERVIKSIFNLAFIIAALMSMGSLGEMAFDMAVNAGKESKRGFLNISQLNAQLLEDRRN